MEADEELARRLQAQFDEEEELALSQEKEDAAYAQRLASVSHDLSDSDEDVTVVTNLKYKPTVEVDVISIENERDEINKRKKMDCSQVQLHSVSDDEEVEAQGSQSVSPHPRVPSPVTNETTSKPDTSAKKRPLCKFGSTCYRKNPWHLEEFYHPHLDNNASGSQSSSYSDKSDPVIKRQKVSSADSANTSTSKDNKRTFASRLASSTPYNLFLNKVYSVKETHDDPLGLVFPDILHPLMGEIVESVQLNFMVDLKYLVDIYKVCRAYRKPLLVMYGSLEGDPKDYENVTCVEVKIPFQFGTHHTKMMLLQYKNGLRVVIHTANLRPDDWEEKTQGFWVSPLFPELEGKKASILDGESPTCFKRDLVDYILAYKAPDLTRWSHIIRKYDFSSCNVFFVGSVPGYHTGEHKDKWGHMKVRKIMRQHATSWKSSLPIIAQCSSIGSLGKDARSWLSGELGLSLTGAAGMCTSLPLMKVVYPSEEDIRTSSQGWCGGSCLPYSSETHAKQEWLMQHFHLWRSNKRRRTRAMPHIKSYARLNKEWTRAQFLIMTSSNLSKAAWGMLQKQASQLFIRSYEAGVLFLPKFVTGTEEFELKSPWKDIGFSLPFDVPVTPYPSGAKPWFMNTDKNESDVFGDTYP
ncbi:tyrosyl-DNA phosphodiesterase 1 [Halocaridina rubra]|uniref:Tyrosyl-DNA phosphodiesterase 1 n=1 Tax=Halocaridina rubra TaxID=373956 RepID=A0AAN9A4W1_HALRR